MEDFLPRTALMTSNLSRHLSSLETEAIVILRETAAAFERPVLMYSIGKDSSVLLHLCRKAFHPAKIPFTALHIDTTWKFRDMITHRDRMAAELDLNLIVHTNTQGDRGRHSPDRIGVVGLYPRDEDQGAARRARLHKFDAAIGGARRDEEPSRSKERIFSVRGPNHSWDPRRQRPELWHLYNSQIAPDETMRVFPLSNWTELDVWEYILAEDIPVVPLYFAKKRPVVERSGSLIMIDDDRLDASARRTAAGDRDPLPLARPCASRIRSPARSGFRSRTGQGRPAARPRGHFVARARHRHGRDSTGHPDRGAAVGGERHAAHRPLGPHDRPGEPRHHRAQVPRRPGRLRGRLCGRCTTRKSRAPGIRATRSTCWRSKSSRWCRSISGRSMASSTPCAAPPRLPSSPAARSRACSTCCRGAIRQTTSPTCGRG